MDFQVQFNPKVHGNIQNYFGEHGLGHAHKLYNQFWRVGWFWHSIVTFFYIFFMLTLMHSFQSNFHEQKISLFANPSLQSIFCQVGKYSSCVDPTTKFGPNSFCVYHSLLHVFMKTSLYSGFNFLNPLLNISLQWLNDEGQGLCNKGGPRFMSQASRYKTSD